MNPAASFRQGRVESGRDSYLQHRPHILRLLKILLSFIVLFSAALAVVVPDGEHTVSTPRQTQDTAARLSEINPPLAFEENSGQTAEEVRFLARGSGYTLFLTNRETVLSLQQPGSRRRDTLRTNLIASNTAARPQGDKPLAASTTYFHGDFHSGSERLKTEVPTFARVRYRSVYPSIDLVYYGRGQQLEYDFIVDPGADPSVIQWEIDGARGLEITAEGNLDIHLPGGVVRHEKPVVYQPAGDGKRPVEGGFRLLAENRVGFKIGPYDHSRTLVIDPVLLYSTYLGARSRDQANAVAVDPQGNIYVAGYTQSIDFPTTPGSLQPAFLGGDEDAFVTKLNPGGATRIFSTFLGGTNNDRVNSLAVDASGNVVICGETRSTNFPVSAGVLQRTYGGGERDGFAAKLASNGSDLIFSTYLGGSEVDACNGVATDPAGNVYAAGTTESANFPFSGGQVFQPAFGGGSEDAFLVRLDPAGGTIYSMFLGGSQSDGARAVAADAAGRAYIAGYTQSDNFPVDSQAAQPSRRGDRDAFLFVMTPPGRLQQTGTFYGGGGRDEANAVTLDADGNVYIAGLTRSVDFPRALASAQNVYGGAGDAFVVKFNPQVSEVLYATFLGGAGEDVASAVAADFAGNVLVAGTTTSRNFPMGAQLGPQDQFGGGGSDAFFAKIDPQGRMLLQSSYVGGTGDDAARAAAADIQGNIYLAGVTESGAFPLTPNAIQSGRAGPEGFLTKIGLDTVTTVSAASFQTDGVVSPDSIVSAFGRGIALQTATAASLPLPTELGGVSIGIRDANGSEFDARLIGVFPADQPNANDQINFVLPAGIADGTARLTVRRNGIAAATGTVSIQRVVPGIFMALPADLRALTNNPNNITAAPPAAITFILTREGVQQPHRLTFQTGRLNAFEPAPINVGLQTDQLILVLFGTGIRNASDVSVRIGDSDVDVLFFGAAPGFAGLDQINARIPFNFFGRGIVELQLTADGKPANVVSLWIE